MEKQTAADGFDWAAIRSTISNTNAPQYVNALEVKVDNSFSFMMNTTSGRAKPSVKCAECASRASWQCAQCYRGRFYCDVCVRTTVEHRGHEATPLVPSPMPPSSFCNGCKVAPLTVPYYHCTVCVDYDLCAGCEAINDECIAIGRRPLHDPTHETIKYRSRVFDKV